eukprot:TRINITY_DN12625_c1_g2_i14.p1 TRINITY_DN12625_c1_g2~~TRINITY_DN12625_c1_g2_i14.p1  ORF type:complete len:159 (-),score=10.60 TRINITY_DN12625_c1_g2_i14:85-561(-)
MSVTRIIGDTCIAHLLHVSACATLRNAQVGRAVMVQDGLLSVLRCMVSTLETVDRLMVSIQKACSNSSKSSSAMTSSSSMVLKTILSSLYGGKAVHLNMGSLAFTCSHRDESAHLDLELHGTGGRVTPIRRHGAVHWRWRWWRQEEGRGAGGAPRAGA